MYFVGLDISLNSTAMSIHTPKGYYFFSYLKNYDKPGKWTKILEDFTKITGVFYQSSEDYSELELLKLKGYQNTANLIIEDIKTVIPSNEKFYVGLEGYSYSSDVGKIIDLVCLGTLIRKELTKLNSSITIFTPSNVKKETCGIVYGWETNKKGKRTGTKNKLGIAGGLFKKPQMLEALKDSDIDSSLAVFSRIYFDDLYSMAKIPSPCDDLIDSHWILEILMLYTNLD